MVVKSWNCGMCFPTMPAWWNKILPVRILSILLDLYLVQMKEFCSIHSLVCYNSNNISSNI